MLNPNRINEILKNCLYKDDEIVNGKPIVEPIIVEGIIQAFGFNPNRIENYKKEIEFMLEDLNPNFKNGWSFLNLCHDKNGNLWTGEHKTMEELMCLGMAINKISYCAPRDFWEVLPGGMPYIKIL